MKPLTLEELRKMDGKPVYWKDDESYGIVSVDASGKWDGIPFFRGRKNGINFEFDIESRGMRVYAIEALHLDCSAWEPCEECESCGNCKHNSKHLCKFGCNDETAFEPVGFCKYCGRPLTDAAWEMLEKRLRGGNDD